MIVKAGDWIDDLRGLQKICESVAVKAYVVGGGIRDALLGAADDALDIDVVAEGNFVALADALKVAYPDGDLKISKFLTLSIDFSRGRRIDLAACRVERYSCPGGLPEVEPGSLEQDAWRRDFTVNALYVELGLFCQWLSESGQEQELAALVIDPCGGLGDLRQRRLEILHSESFRDDPTRIFRAARYFAMLANGRHVAQEGPMLVEALTIALDENGLSNVSHFRKFNELRRCFQYPLRAQALRYLIEKGVFECWPPVIQPEIFRTQLSLLGDCSAGILELYGYEVFLMIMYQLRTETPSKNLLSDMRVKSAWKERVDKLVRGSQPPETELEKIFMEIVSACPLKS